jgi:hypothetical protein
MIVCDNDGFAGRRAGSWIGWTFFLTLLPLLVTSCGERDRDTAATTPQVANTATTAAPGVGVTVNDITGKLDQYLGKTVTVAGEINDVLGPRAFTIGGEEFYGGGELLVVSTRDFPAIPDRPQDEYLVDDDIVQVTGTVRRFVLTEVEKEVGTDLDGALYARWESKPVLLAQSFVVTPRVKRTAAGAPGPAVAPGATRLPADPLADLIIILSTPDRPSLVGRQVQLTNVQVRSVVGDKAFWVGPSEAQRLFVVLDEERTPGTPTEGRVNVNPGQTVTVSGVLRRSPSAEEARRRLGLSAANAATLAKEQIYLQAQRVQITQR